VALTSLGPALHWPLLSVGYTLRLEEIKPRGDHMAQKRKAKKTKTKRKRIAKKNKPKEWFIPEVEKSSVPEVDALDEALERAGKATLPDTFRCQ